LRNQGGEIVTTDGLFIESKEQIGGYFDHQSFRPRRGARLGPQACARDRDAIEVRPFMEGH
jgi:hypothetical protein